MISQVYIDNFKCLVNFEHKLTSKELIIGANGSGKSSFMDALLFVRQFVMTGLNLKDPNIPNTPNILLFRTRWQVQSQMTFELHVQLDPGKYVYRLIIEPWRDAFTPRVALETVNLDGKPIFEFLEGEVHLFNDKFERKVQYDFDWNRSALGTILPRPDNQKLNLFKEFLSRLYCFRINPFPMVARSEKEDLFPNVDLSNIASWYRNLLQADPMQNAQLHEDLRNTLDNFLYLELEAAGENVRLLAARFAANGESTTRFYFNELSEGQRCLVCLYSIVHFVLAKGNTVILDEPDNFISLREIQPWLIAAEDAVERGHGQLLIISHHPELLNQWAADNGLQFFREKSGPVRVRPFHGLPGSDLSPAELAARGWDNE